jgi:hypothetical protein
MFFIFCLKIFCVGYTSLYNPVPNAYCMNINWLPPFLGNYCTQLIQKLFGFDTVDISLKSNGIGNGAIMVVTIAAAYTTAACFYPAIFALQCCQVWRSIGCRCLYGWCITFATCFSPQPVLRKQWVFFLPCTYHAIGKAMLQFYLMV